MKYAWIQQHARALPVDACCRVLNVSRGGYYRWANAEPPKRSVVATERDAHVRRVFDDSHGIYGYRKVHAELHRRGQACRPSLNTVAASMKRQGLASRVKRRKRPRTTVTDPGHPKAANVLNRDFTADTPNTKWVTDLTYVATDTGWTYLAMVTDLFSRRIVGWSMADHMRTELVVGAMRDAIEQRRPGRPPAHLGGVRLDAELMLHSDRGSQFTSEGFTTMLATLGIRQSMSRVAECYDNAVAESVFGSLKGEWVDHHRYADLAEARASIRVYLQWFNTERRHQSLDYLTPDEKENMFDTHLHPDPPASPTAIVAVAG